MPEMRRKYDQVFREGAVRVVRETGKSIAQVAEDLGIPKGTLANWVARDRVARGEKLDPRRVDPERLRQLEKEVAELRMERDVLKRSVVLWVKEATRWAWRRSSPPKGRTTTCPTPFPAGPLACRRAGSTSGPPARRPRVSCDGPRSSSGPGKSLPCGSFVDESVKVRLLALSVGLAFNDELPN